MPKVDNFSFYNKSLLEYGPTSKGVRWNSKDSQYTRFDIITKYIKNIQDYTIGDAGCGVGEYYIYLKNNNKIPKKYIGLDIQEQMISLALNRVNADFYIKDIVNDNNLPIVDYYISSGALNILTKQESYKFIKNIYNNSTKGIIFNMLKREGISESKVFNTFDIFEALSFCKTLSNNIQYKDGYLDNDFTIFIRKDHEYIRD